MNDLPGNLNTRQLYYLEQAVQHGSLNRAAGALGISQPALSKAIATLEQQLGVDLLRRSRRGVEPTGAGRRVLNHGKDIRELAEQLLVRPASRQRPADGIVRVGCGPSEATRLLPMALASLGDTPTIKDVTVLYGLNEDLMPMVKRGDIDFALSSVPRNATDPDLLHEVLLHDSAGVIASANHPLATGNRIEPAMLLEYPWVLARRRELERRALDDLFLRANIKPPDAAVETTSATLMKSLLMVANHLSFLPREMIHWELQAGQLVHLTVHTEGWERQVGITRRRQSRLRRASQVLIERITETAHRM